MATAQTHNFDSQKEVVQELEIGLEVADRQYHQGHPPYSTESKHPDADSEEFYPHFSHLPPVPPLTPLPPAAPDRRIFGLRRTTFILSAALVAVIMAAVIGGGVGSALSIQRAEARCQENQSQLFNPSATASGRIIVPTSGVLALDCPAISGTTIEVSTTPDPKVQFLVQCGVDIVENGTDILTLTAYSLSDCLGACASLNHNSGRPECKAAVFNADMELVERGFGTCKLKKSSTGQVKVAEGLVSLSAAGVLVL